MSKVPNWYTNKYATQTALKNDREEIKYIDEEIIEVDKDIKKLQQVPKLKPNIWDKITEVFKTDHEKDMEERKAIKEFLHSKRKKLMDQTLLKESLKQKRTQTIEAVKNANSELKDDKELKVDIIKLIGFGLEAAVHKKDDATLSLAKHILSNPEVLGATSSMLLNIRSALKKELGDDYDKDKNKIIQSKFVAKIIADANIWNAIEVEKPNIAKAISLYHQEIDDVIKNSIDTPGPITTKSKLSIVASIFSNPNAIKAIQSILSDTGISDKYSYMSVQSALMKYIASSKEIKKRLEEVGINQQYVAELLPNILDIAGSFLNHSDDIKNVLNTLKEIITLEQQSIDDAKKIENIKLSEGLPADVLAYKTTKIKDPKDQIENNNNKIIKLKDGVLNSVLKLAPSLLSDEKLLPGISTLLASDAIKDIITGALENNKDVKAQLAKFGIESEQIVKIVPDFMAIVGDMSKLLTSKESRSIIKDNILPNIEILLKQNPDGTDEEKTQYDQEKQKAFFRIVDSAIKMLSQEKDGKKPIDDVYTKLQPFLQKNTELLEKLINDVVKQDSLGKKLDINVGKLAIDALCQPKIFIALKDMYEAYQSGQYFGAASSGLKLIWDSKEVRDIAWQAIYSVLHIIWNEKMPDFMRRSYIGNDVKNIITTHLEGTHQEGERRNLGEIFDNAVKSEEYTALGGTTQYSLENKLCKGLKFYGVNFSNCDINGFDFTNVGFGDKLGDKISTGGVSFQNSTITDVNFSGAILNGPINLDGATFDSKSLISLLPSLDKALAAGQIISSSPITLTNQNEKDMEIIAQSKFGKQYLGLSNLTQKQDTLLDGTFVTMVNKNKAETPELYKGK